MANSFTEPQNFGFAKAWSRTWFSGCSSEGTLSEAAERGDRFGDEVIIPIDAGGFPEQLWLS
jgi:hypothetical protein